MKTLAVLLLVYGFLNTGARADDNEDTIAQQRQIIEQQQQMINAQRLQQAGAAVTNFANQLSRPANPPTNCVSVPNVFGGYNVQCR